MLLHFFVVLLVSSTACLLTYFACRIAVQRGVIRHGGIISRQTADRLMALSALVYAIVFSALSILRFLSFNQDGYDLSIFDQAVWNSLNGRLLQTSFLPDVSFLLAQRFSPILLAFVPLYAIWSSPIVLMVIQTIGIAAASFPIYWFARSRVGNLLALIVAWGFFLFPSLEYTNLFEFHELALAVPLISYATFFLLRQNWRPFFILMLVALLVKEELAFIVSAVGIYIFIVQRKRWLGFALALFGMIWIFLLLQFLIPYFRGDPASGYYYFGNGIAAGIGRYDYLGHSLSEVAFTILTRPDIVLPHLLTSPKILYVLNLLLPLAFVSVAGIDVSLIALPIFGISLLSEYPPQYSIEFYYGAPAFPLLFFGAIVGLRRLLRWRVSGDAPEIERANRRVALAALIFVASAATFYDQAPGPVAMRFDSGKYTLDAHTALGNSLLQIIPRDAVVVAQQELAPHLAERRSIYGFPPVIDYCRADYVVVDAKRFRYHLFENEWEEWRNSGNFQIIVEQDGYVVAKRAQPDHPVNIQFGDQMTLLDYTLGAVEMKRGGKPLCLNVEWRPDRAIQTRYVVRVQLQDQQGHVFAQDEHEPGQGRFPLNQWSVQKSVPDLYSIAIPPTAPSGIYQITATLYDPLLDRFLQAADASGQNLGIEPVIAVVRVEKDTSSKAARELRIENPFFVDIGEIRLLGYSAIPKDIARGNPLAVGLYWRARGKPRGDYIVQIQLQDANQKIVAEQASRPARGVYPTTLWREGEVLLDWHDLDLSAGLVAGEYVLSVALRDATTQTVLGETVLTTINVQN